MIRLEQIQLLEKKIDKAVEVIELLKKENQALRNTLNKSQVKMGELENLLEQFKGEQNKIEAGIMSALSKLDHLEDEVSEIRIPAAAKRSAEVKIPPGEYVAPAEPVLASTTHEAEEQDQEPETEPVEDQGPIDEDSDEQEDEDVPEDKEIELDIF